MRRRQKKPPRAAKPATPKGGYVLIARGPDGRLRSERFADAAAYRARLAALERSGGAGVSIDEIADWLDA